MWCSSTLEKKECMGLRGVTADDRGLDPVAMRQCDSPRSGGGVLSFILSSQLRLAGRAIREADRLCHLTVGSDRELAFLRFTGRE